MFCKKLLIASAIDFVTSFSISESSKVVRVIIPFSFQNRLTFIADKPRMISFPFCESQRLHFIERNNT